MKELTHEDAMKFWEYLDKEYYKISIQLPSKAFHTGAIISHKPAKMREEDYKEYEQILKSWLVKEGFMK